MRKACDSQLRRQDLIGQGNFSLGAIISLTVLGYLTFLIVAAAVRTDYSAALDRSAILALRDANDVSNPIGPPVFEESAIEITALGGYPALVLISVIALGGLLVLRERQAAGFLTLSVVGGALLSTGSKKLFARERPDLVDHLDRTFTHSFPSAHASMSMIVFLTLAAIASRLVGRTSFRVYAISSAVLFSMLIGTSRIYLGVHWPSDVVAGWALGAAWVGTVWLADDLVRRRNAATNAIGKSSPTEIGTS